MVKWQSIQKNGDLWMYDLATDNNNAKAVEERLLMLGFDGAALNSDPKATAVYVYKKKGHTKEW